MLWWLLLETWTQKVLTTSKTWQRLLSASFKPIYLTSSRAASVMSAWMSVCECWECLRVCLCTDNKRGGPVVCCPQGSDLIKAVSVSLWVHTLHRGEKGRETPAQTGGRWFGSSSGDQKVSFCLKSGLCGGQIASTSTASHLPQRERASKKESSDWGLFQLGECDDGNLLLCWKDVLLVLAFKGGEVTYAACQAFVQLQFMHMLIYFELPVPSFLLKETYIFISNSSSPDPGLSHYIWPCWNLSI